MARTEQQRRYWRQWRRLNAERLRPKLAAQARARRSWDGGRINAQHRALSAQRRALAREARAAEARSALGREPWTLDEWFAAQGRFGAWAEVARSLGVSPPTLLRWRRSGHPPTLRHQKALYDLTRLPLYADAALWREPPPRCRTTGEAAAVPLIYDLVVRCGLATREIQALRLSQVEAGGIMIGGRLLRIGDGWEMVRRASLDDWLARAHPTDQLFFRRKPVDRGRPCTRLWIVRKLAASGVTLRARRSARTRHFAGDLRRLGARSKFTQHLCAVHGLSSSGATAVLHALRKLADGLPKGALGRVPPEDVYDVLASPAGPAGAARKKGGRPRGRPKGMAVERRRQAEAIGHACTAYQMEHGTKRGMWAYAARKVLGARSDSRSAVERARWLARKLRGWKNSERN